MGTGSVRTTQHGDTSQHNSTPRDSLTEQRLFGNSETMSRTKSRMQSASNADAVAVL